LPFTPLHGIYLFNKQHEEQTLLSQWPVLHWLLTIKTDYTDGTDNY